MFIETSDLIVVVEGKRTEPAPTTDTGWMPGRHQMLRHLDCAWEIRGTKRVAGFFIVEGDGSGDIPDAWRKVVRDTVSSGTIALSLPHRSGEEQNAIVSCFAGVTTWQRVCREFGIEHASLPNEACN